MVVVVCVCVCINCDATNFAIIFDYSDENIVD